MTTSPTPPAFMRRNLIHFQPVTRERVRILQRRACTAYDAHRRTGDDRFFIRASVISHASKLLVAQAQAAGLYHRPPPKAVRPLMPLWLWRWAFEGGRAFR